MDESGRGEKAIMGNSPASCRDEGQGCAGLHYTLLKTPQPSNREIWDGPVMSCDVLTGVFGADEAHPLSEGSLRTCLEQRLARSTAQNILFMDRDRPCSELSYALRHVITDPAPRRQGGWSTTEVVGDAAGGTRCLQVRQWLCNRNPWCTPACVLSSRVNALRSIQATNRRV